MNKTLSWNLYVKAWKGGGPYHTSQDSHSECYTFVSHISLPFRVFEHEFCKSSMTIPYLRSYVSELIRNRVALDCIHVWFPSVVSTYDDDSGNDYAAANA
jgi:hypothetical protein